MPRALPVACLNGRLQPLAECTVSPLDRGFLFADGVYEVIPAYGGRLFRLAEHVRRLQCSLDGIQLRNPHTVAEWEALLTALVAANGGGTQSVYVQVTRGIDPNGRDHAFPDPVIPTVFAMSQDMPGLPEATRRDGIAAMTLADIRWRRCDVKSIDLLANVLLRQQAAEQGCAEAILVRDGFAIEGTSSTLFVVHDGVLRTPPNGPELLPGITRALILELAAANGVDYREERVPLAVLGSAEEVWISSSTREVVPVTRLDGRPVGSGRPGPHWQRMYELIQRFKAGAAT